MVRTVLGWLALLLASPIAVMAIIVIAGFAEGYLPTEELISRIPGVFTLVVAIHLAAFAVMAPIFAIGAAISRRSRWVEQFFTGALFVGGPVAIGWDWLTANQVQSWALVVTISACGIVWALADKSHRDEDGGRSEGVPLGAERREH